MKKLFKWKKDSSHYLTAEIDWNKYSHWCFLFHAKTLQTVLINIKTNQCFIGGDIKTQNEVKITWGAINCNSIGFTGRESTHYKKMTSLEIMTGSGTTSYNLDICPTHGRDNFYFIPEVLCKYAKKNMRGYPRHFNIFIDNRWYWDYVPYFNQYIFESISPPTIYVPAILIP